MQVLWLLLLLGVTQACLILFCYIVTAFFFFFSKFKVGGNSVSNKSLGAFSPETFAHFVSLSYFGNSCNM